MARRRSNHSAATPDLPTWQHWIRQLTNDVIIVVAWHEIWQQMATAVDGNQNIPRTLAMGYLSTTYYQSQSVAVRRLVDQSRDVISFARLLQSVRAHSQLITRDWWLSQYADPLDRRIAAPEWDSEFGGTVGDHLDPRIVQSDLQALRAEVHKVETLVDKVVAHRVLDYSGPMVTQGDLNTAIDRIARLFQKYCKLLLVVDQILIPPATKKVMATFSVPWV